MFIRGTRIRFTKNRSLFNAQHLVIPPEPSSLMMCSFIYLICGLSLHCLKCFIERAPHLLHKGQIWICRCQAFTLLQVVTQTSSLSPLNHADVQPSTVLLELEPGSDSYITQVGILRSEQPRSHVTPEVYIVVCAFAEPSPLSLCSNHTVYTAASSPSPWLSWKAAEPHQCLTLLLINQNFTTSAQEPLKHSGFMSWKTWKCAWNHSESAFSQHLASLEGFYKLYKIAYWDIFCGVSHTFI